jgi:hypothetical protein
VDLGYRSGGDSTGASHVDDHPKPRFLDAINILVCLELQRSEPDLNKIGTWIEIAPEPTGHGLPLSKCEAYNRVYEQPYGSS